MNHTFRVFFAIMLVSTTILADSGAPSGKTPDTWSDTLDLLHDGRFDEAEEALAALSEPASDTVAYSFFRAFVTYWRLLYDDDDIALQDEFENRLRQTITLGDQELRRSPENASLKLWKGTSHLLLAQLRAAQKKPFGAAFEAKKAKKLLDKAFGASPEVNADSAFGLGTYQYFADRVPAIVKGLRVLLFIPGGDREKGLKRLEFAADRSTYFSLEARLLLATIYSSSHERNYLEGLDQAVEAVRLFPHSIAAQHAASKLEIEIYRPGKSLARLEKVLAEVESNSGLDRAVEATLIYHAARSEFSLFRPDLALERLRPILLSDDGVPESLLGKVRANATLYAALSPTRPEWYSVRRSNSSDPLKLRIHRKASQSIGVALEALEEERAGHPADAAALLLSLAGDAGDDPVLALLAGRALVLEGRGSEALPLLSRAERSGSLPASWLGPCRLLAGMAADLTGNRTEAVRWYGKAQRSSGFAGKDAAFLYQGRPFIQVADGG